MKILDYSPTHTITLHELPDSQWVVLRLRRKLTNITPHSAICSAIIALLLVKRISSSLLFIQITQMTRLIKDEFIKTVDTLPWMSEETKANAVEKVSGLSEMHLS